MPDEFIDHAKEKLRRAFSAGLGASLAAEALAEALAHLAENEGRIRQMDSPVGYLYTVGRRRALRFSRFRHAPVAFPPPAEVGVPEVEPGLTEAMARLSERQRVCVTLVHGFGYRHREVAELLGVSTETVQTHCRRALAALRSDLGVDLT